MQEQEWAYERAKITIEDGECSAEEIYHGIDCMFYADIINHEQYENLMKLFDAKYPGYREEAI